MIDFYQNQNLSEKKTVNIRDRWKRKTKQLNIKLKIESVTDRWTDFNSDVTEIPQTVLLATAARKK